MAGQVSAQLPAQALPQAQAKAATAQATPAQANVDPNQIGNAKAKTDALTSAQTAQTSESNAAAVSEADAKAKVKDLLLRQASMTTGSAMSGLQPWNKGWVMEGMNPADAQSVKPLLSKEQGMKTMEDNSMMDTVNQGDLQKILKSLENQLQEVRGNADVMGASPEVLANESNLKSFSPNANARMGSEDFMSVRKSMQDSSQIANPENANQVAGKNADAVQRVGMNSASMGGLSLNNSGGQSGEPMEIQRDRSDMFSPERAGALAALSQQGLAQKRPPVELSGQLTRGSMMKERLTTESLNDVSSNISKFAPDGGGEMRIRLKPDNLGELAIRVSTDRRGQVNLAIQTANPQAKAVIQESLSSLRDKLADKRLTLGKVEFGVGIASAQVHAAQSPAFDMGSRMDNNPNSQSQQFNMNYAGSDGSNQTGGRERGRDVYENERSSSDSRLKKSSSASQISGMSPLSHRASGSEGRLEVWA